MQSDDLCSKPPVEEVENTSSYTVLLKDEYQPGRAFYMLSQLRRRQQFCDVQVYKDAACFSVHRVILAASSPYLLSLLLSSSPPAEQPGRITLTDPKLTVGALELLIDFMYTSMLRIKENTVEALCYAARLLQLGRIEKACCKFIVNNLKVHNCFRYLQYSAEHNYPEIRSKCLEHAALNFAEISCTPGFLDMGIADLTSVIQSPKLNASSQEVVLEAVLQWVNQAPSARQGDLYPLLQSIKERTLPLKGDERVREILESPRTSTEQVVRSLKACFEKLQRNHNEEWPGEKQRESKRELREATPPDANSKIRRKVHFELEEDTPSKRPECEQQQGDWKAEGEFASQQQHSSSESRDQIPSVKQRRRQGSAAIFAVGGVTNYSNTSSVEKYDLKKKGNWAAATALPQKKSHAALVSSGNKVYSIGGYTGSKRLSSVDVYNTKTDKWSNAAPMPTARSGFGATVDREGRVYCIGGYSGSQQDLSDVDIYDPEHNQWTPGPRLNQRRSYVQAATLGDSIYAVGGTEGSTRLQTVEKLLPHDASSWDRVADLNVARSRPGVASLDGHLFAVGGYSGSEHLDSVECYSPTSNCWRMMESMNVPRNSPATAVHDGRLYVAGGHSGKELLHSVECYDPQTNQWSSVAPMNTARCDFGMATVEGGSLPDREREMRKEPQPVGTWI